MRIFETPKLFNSVDTDESENLPKDFKDLTGGSLEKLPRRHIKKMACMAKVLCADGTELHRIGLSRKGRFFAFNHPDGELTADAVVAHLGGQPNSCTRIFLQIRAAFDWLKFDKNGDFVYDRAARWKAITKNEEGEQRFLHGFHPAFFEQVLRGIARKYRRHEAVLRAKLCKNSPNSSQQIISANWAKGMSVIMEDPCYAGADLLSLEVGKIRKRYRHLAHLLKSDAYAEDQTELIYRYIP